MTVAATAFPLVWPAGWSRTSYMEKLSGVRFKEMTTFNGPYRDVTFDSARRKLANELKRMNATNIVLSTNIPLRLDGQARGSYASVEDAGVAIYFTFKGRAMVMACDRYDTVAANTRSLGLAIEALRKLERHGGGTMMERAFSGFVALPPPGRPWRVVLGFGPNVPITKWTIEDAFRTLAKSRHPDCGGSDDAMSELTTARNQAMGELSAQQEPGRK